MRSRTSVVSLAVAALAFAGCGGSKQLATSGASSQQSIPGVTSFAPPPPPRSLTYSVGLSGTAGGRPYGAPHATALAQISLNPFSRELCWEFSQLKNVDKPTIARIYTHVQFGPGNHGIPLGPTYKPSGCVHEPPIAFTIFEAHPKRYYVSIHTVKFPNGAVRGPLEL